MATKFVTDTIGSPNDSNGYESITPGDTATGITITILTNSSGKKATGAFVTVEDNDLNITVHGVNPTAKAGTNVGFKLSPGQSYTISDQQEVVNFKCIDRVSGSTGTAKITLYYP